MQKAVRQRLTRFGLNLSSAACFLLFGLWALGGTLFTAVVAFMGVVMTFGLAVWPLVILGALVFWGPLFVAIRLGRIFLKAVRAWADKEDPDPFLDVFAAHTRARFSLAPEKCAEGPRLPISIA